MKTASRNLVSQALEGYARRGIFRSYSRVAAEGAAIKGVTEFRFLWLTPVAVHVIFDANRDTLTFQDLLPAMPRDSELARELKEFIKSCTAEDRPEHRRLNPDRLGVAFRNRRGNLSLIFRVQPDDHEYGVRKAVNLVNEIFLSFLAVYHAPYMVKHFQASEE